MSGREILIGPGPGGGGAAALFVDGRIEDLILDPPPGDTTPRPESVHLARVDRAAKGLGGAFVRLGGGATGFLRGRSAPAPGARLLVQVSAWAEPGKAPPLGARIRLKGRLAVLTPGAPGVNVSRAIGDETLRAQLTEVGVAALGELAADAGLIVRTAAASWGPEALHGEIAALAARFRMLAAATGGEPRELAPGPDAEGIALRDWLGPGDRLRDGADDAVAHDIEEAVARLRNPVANLGAGDMRIEATRALVAVDVNTGGDFSPAAALKANLTAAGALPRELRLRGLGGQVVVDFAPIARSERRRIETALAAALRDDSVETTVLGWTGLGLLELRRKRARRPL